MHPLGVSGNFTAKYQIINCPATASNPGMRRCPTCTCLILACPVSPSLSHHVSPFVSCVTQTRSPNRSERIFPPSEVVAVELPVLPQAAAEAAADDSPVGGGGGGGSATPSLLLLRRIISGSGDGVDLKRWR